MEKFSPKVTIEYDDFVELSKQNKGINELSSKIKKEVRKSNDGFRGDPLASPFIEDVRYIIGDEDIKKFISVFVSSIPIEHIVIVKGSTREGELR